MTSHFLTRVCTVALLATSAWLSACGSSEVNAPFKPSRIVVFGDGLNDVTASAQYTVNGDGSVNNWVNQVAARYGVSVVSYAKGNARISTSTGAGGVAVTTLTAQVAGFSYQADDLVIINGGFSDLIAEANTTTGGANSTTNATAYGTALANLVRSMVTAGAKRIAVANVYDLSKTPAAGIVTNLATQNTNNRGALVAAFNDALKSNLGSSSLSYIGDNVRLLDTEAFLSSVRTAPAANGFVDTSTVVCNSNDTANGIGLGTNRVNSKLCTTSTLAQSSYNSYVFADSVYPTPAFHRAWGNSAYTQIASRW